MPDEAPPRRPLERSVRGPYGEFNPPPGGGGYTTDELARQILALRQEAQQRDDADREFQSELRGQMAQFTATLTQLSTAVQVNKAEANAKISNVERTIRDHEGWHSTEAKNDKERREGRALTASIVSGVLTAAGTLFGVVVALLIR